MKNPNEHVRPIRLGGSTPYLLSPSAPTSMPAAARPPGPHDLSASTDPTTERMRQETGHDCITCPTDVRNLMATAHNAIGALDAARKGTGSWERAWRKVERLRSAEAALQPTAGAHFEALNGWRRP